MKKIFYIMTILMLPVISSASEYLTYSEFDKAQFSIKYSVDNQKYEDAETDDISYNAGSTNLKPTSYKSPGKAFALSLLVPGLGQHYVGESKLKSAAFFAVDVVSWVLYFKKHADADDLTDAYEQFNHDHWIEARYDSMLAWTYDSLIANGEGPFPELSHTLPDTKTQQYYEMTGKYNQFSWGWDDAILLSDSSVFSDYSSSNPMERVVSTNVPYSAHRFTYETMRDDANNKYDQARKMIYVSLLNRMFSAFEAMISAKKRNNNASTSILSSLSAEASYKSLYVKRDTPYLTLNMKF